MKKAKKIVALLLTGVLTISLSGCFKNQVLDGDGMVNSEPVSATSEIASEEPSDSGWEKPSQLPLHEDIPMGLPYVQIGEAVYYDGQVLFREYSANAIDNEALFGKFSFNNYCFVPGGLYTFDPKNPDAEPKFVCEDSGFGDMYLIGEEKLYSNKRTNYSEEDVPEYKVYCTDLNSGESNEVANGTLLGFSPNGKHYVTSLYATNPFLNHFYIFDAENGNNEVAHYTSDSTLFFLGMDDTNIYFLEEEEGNNETNTPIYKVMQFGFDGSEYYLADCDFHTVSEYYYPNYDGNITILDDSISFQVDFYEGTGHFYSGSVKADVPTSKGVPESDDAIFNAKMEFIQEEEDPEAVLPMSIADIANEYSDYESGRGFAKVLQYYTTLNGGIFYAVAECVREPMNDIGWRESYMFSNMNYYYLPDEEKSPVLIHRMYEPLGSRGSLEEYEYYETQPNMMCMAGFFKDENDKLVGIYYEPVNIEGPEGPIEESNSFYIADFADKFYWEHPHDEDIYDKFDVEGLEEFTKYIYSWEPKKDMPVKDAEYDYEGNLVIGSADYSFEGSGVIYLHITFDEKGNVNYVRPVIFD